MQTLKASKSATLVISQSLDLILRLSERICLLQRSQRIGERGTVATDKNKISARIAGVVAADT